MTAIIFNPNTNVLAGTPIGIANLNALVVAQSFIISGGVPPSSGTLTVAQPATQVVVNTGTAAIYITKTSQSLTMIASNDNYVDLDSAGAYHVVSVANNAPYPAVTANSVRLYLAVTTATTTNTPVQLALSNGLPQSGIVQVNPTVMGVDTTLSGSASFTNISNMTIASMLVLTADQAASAKLWFHLSGTVYNADQGVGGVNWQVLVTQPNGAVSTIPLHGSFGFPTGTSNHMPVSCDAIFPGIPPGRYSFVLQYQSTAGHNCQINAASVPGTDGLALIISQYA